MKRILKWLKRGLLAVGLLLVITLAIGLTYREIVQARTEAQMVLDEPNAIDEELFVTAGGTEQGISIRGRNRRNPLLLVIHGGPGVGNGPLLAEFAPLERRYTLVQWDQPGSGKTFRRSGNALPAELTIDDIVADGLEVAEIVRKRLGVERLILLGRARPSAAFERSATSRPGSAHALSLRLESGTARAVPACSETKRDSYANAVLNIASMRSHAFSDWSWS